MVKHTHPQTVPRKKQQLITAAGTLFCAHGMRRITVEEICRQANVSKMTFYKYFDNKTAIAKAVIDDIIAAGIRIFYELIEEQISFVQKLEKLLLLTSARVHALGGPFIEELMQAGNPAHDYFMARQKKARELSVDFFTKAQKDGNIHNRIKLPVLLFMLDRTLDLLNHPDFIAIMPDIEDRANELAALLLHGFNRSAGMQQQ